MTTKPYVTFAARPEDGLAVYGPFTEHSDARMSAEWLGCTDPHIMATRAVALFPPGEDPFSDAEVLDGDVFQLPDEIASLVATRTVEATTDDGTVVALVILADDDVEPPTFAVGPFSYGTGQRWVERVSTHGELHGGLHTARCYLVAVRPSVLDLGTAATTPPTPAAVLLDTDTAAVAYGPFASGMDAALYWRDVLRVLHLSDVRSTYICDLTPPSGAQVPVASNSTDERLRGWALRVPGRDDNHPDLIGPFPDEDTARDWHPDSTADATGGHTVPIYQP